MASIHIGTSGWSYKDWSGNFYPAKARPTDYLSLYSQHFHTVEIDSTFYGIPRKSTVDGWYKAVPNDFIFAAKMPREITHESDLTGVESTVAAFLKSIACLKEKLGPILIQFAYSFKPDMFSNLSRFLDSLPADFKFIVEIRNKKWLDERLYDMLREKSTGLALLDHPWMPKPEIVTSRMLYIRFLGDRKAVPDDFSHVKIDREKELAGWEKMVTALQEKVDDFYGYFNNHYSGHSPTTAKRFLQLLEQGN